MQAILTRYIGPTNFRGARIKAACARGSITISYPYDKSGEECHVQAAQELCEKFAAEDKARYGTRDKNPWLAPRVCGQLPSGEYAHVFKW